MLSSSLLLFLLLLMFDVDDYDVDVVLGLRGAAHGRQRRRYFLRLSNFPPARGPSLLGACLNCMTLLIIITSTFWRNINAHGSLPARRGAARCGAVRRGARARRTNTVARHARAPPPSPSPLPFSFPFPSPRPRVASALHGDGVFQCGVRHIS